MPDASASRFRTRRRTWRRSEGRSRFLGTNPVAIGIPAGREQPLIFDASTSVVARGKIIVAAHTGQSIPEGWAVDPDGHPTTDANLALAGAVLPFGGPKGSAISFIIDILCGVLTGAAFASHLNTLEDLTTVQNVGHVLAAVRTDLFVATPNSGSGWMRFWGCSRPRRRARGSSACWRRGKSNWRTNPGLRARLPLPPRDRLAAGCDLAIRWVCPFPPAWPACPPPRPFEHERRRRTDLQFPPDSDRRALRVRSGAARQPRALARRRQGVRRHRSRRPQRGDCRPGHLGPATGRDSDSASTIRSPLIPARG